MNCFSKLIGIVKLYPSICKILSTTSFSSFEFFHLFKDPPLINLTKQGRWGTNKHGEAEKFGEE
jgi:hypothetical protein